MAKKYKLKDNALLVPFEFVVDLDLAIWRLIRDKYADSDLVDKDIISIKLDDEIKYNLLCRQSINPLELLIPEQSTNELYDNLMNDPEQFRTLLTYAEPYHTLGLMSIFLSNASSVYIDILCRDQDQSDYIHKEAPELNTIIYPNRSEVPVNDYSVLYTKFYKDLLDYNQDIEGKHIYLPLAQYNMQHNMNTINLTLISTYGQFNSIHLIDLYQDVKFRFIKPSNNSIEKEVDAENEKELNQE